MQTLERLLRHDAATTKALLDLAGRLSDAELDCPFDIGHGSLRKTLQHIVRTMERWCDLMRGTPQRSMGGGVQGSDGIPALLTRLDMVSEELLALGENVTRNGREEELFIDSLGVPARLKPLGAGLVHVATHGMHHRSQCLYMMKKLGVQNLVEGDALSWERQYRGLSVWPSAENSAHD